MNITSPIIHISALAILTIEVHGSSILINQPISTGLADFAPTGFGQSFTATEKSLVNAIDLYVSSSSGGSDAVLSVYTYDSSTSTLGSTLLSSGTFFESDLSTSPKWIRINLVTPVSVDKDGEYAFMVVANDPGGSTGWNNYGVNSSDVYFEGSRLESSGSQRSTDLAFSVVVVPEPSSTLLFGVGVGCLILHRRRN